MRPRLNAGIKVTGAFVDTLGRPVKGTVEFTDSSGKTIVAKVRRNGKVKVRLKSGRYNAWEKLGTFPRRQYVVHVPSRPIDLGSTKCEEWTG